MKKVVQALVLCSLLGTVLACGGGGKSAAANQQPTTVTLTPATAATLVNQTLQLTANTAANWAVTEKNGGSVTNAGLYTAPSQVGVFHITATSVADPTKSATAAIDVSAQFASLQELPGGTSLPWSVTPILTTLKSDGTWATAGLIDTSTNQPVDTNLYDIALSPDGQHAVFTMMTPGTYNGQDTYFQNIGIADADGKHVTQLTNNEQVTSDFLMDTWPQFSPDSKSIIYSHYDSTSGKYGNIVKMNLDGTNVQTIFSQDKVYTWWPTYSPDGRMIVLEMAQQLGNGYYDGIATMNADGTNVVQLTGIDAQVSPCYGYDEMPAWSSDGQQIAFTRECWPDAGGVYNVIYGMKPDGSGLAPLFGNAVSGTLAFQPRMSENKKFVFSSNATTPGTYSGFDLYYVASDGTNLQLTNNSLYDAFSVWWLGYNETTPAARAFRAQSPIERRLQHHKMLLAHRVH